LSAPSSPVSLPSASADIDIILNKSPFNATDRTSFDVNGSLETFLQHLYALIAKRTKLSDEKLQSATKIIRWRWLTKNKAQAQKIAKFYYLDTQEDYQQLQNDVRSTARKNPHLDNMILRLQVDVSTNSISDVDASIAFIDLPPSAERVVIGIS